MTSLKNNSKPHRYGSLQPVHLQPSFHYDVEYLRTYEFYRDLSIENLREASRLLKRHTDYTFHVEQTILLEEFFARHPSERTRWRRYVRQGRVDFSPGMYVMPDTNIPSGESFIRQVIHGRWFLEKQLGCRPTVAFMADCTGHHAQLPQIVRSCGYLGYALVRAVPSQDFPSRLMWEGLDRTRIPTLWMAGGYHGILLSGDRRRDVAAFRGVVRELRRRGGGSEVFFPLGGDFVYPDARALALVRAVRQGGEAARFSTFANYFCSPVWKSARLWRGEFNPDRQGTYSTRIWIKQANRRMENRLFALEALAAWRWLFQHRAFPARAFERVWRLVLKNQFHDTIWGTVVDDCADAARARIEKARRGCDEIQNRVSASLGKRAEGTLAIFNPALHPREAVLRWPAVEGRAGAEPGGKMVSSQRAGGDVLGLIKLGAGGVTPLRAVPARRMSPFVSHARRRPARPGGSFPGSTEIGVQNAVAGRKAGRDLIVRNRYLQVSFSPSGAIRSLRLFPSGAEYVDPQRPWFHDLCLQSDNGDLWQYYESPLLDGAPRGFESECIADPLPSGPRLSASGKRHAGIVLHSAAGAKQVELLSDGAVCTQVRVAGSFTFARTDGRRTYTMGIDLPYQTVVSILHHRPWIEFQTEVHCVKGRRYRLRAAFPTNIRRGKILHEIPFGFLQRPEGEFPAQNWMAYEDRTKGIALFNRGLPGNNTTDGVMMLSLMRSVAMEYKGRSDGAYEEGRRFVFEYAILPYEARNKPLLSKLGLDFNLQPVVLPQSASVPHAGFRLSAEEILCSSCQASDEGVVFRLWESSGRRVACHLHCPARIRRATAGDVLGDHTVPVFQNNGRSIRLVFRPFEIKTIRIQVARASTKQ